MTNAGHGVATHRMCRTHVGSCHAEIHQELARIKKNQFDNSTLRHIIAGEIIPEEMADRHNQLADELDTRAEQTGSGNGHNPETKHRPQEYGNIAFPTELVAGLPVQALKLLQRNVFRNKDCACLSNDWTDKIPKIEAPEAEYNVIET